MLLVLFAVAACSSDDGQRGGDGPRADPQVVQDVVEFLMPLPLPEGQARGLRISNFNRSQFMVFCGSRPIPLDYVPFTSGQGVFYNLSLLEERGVQPLYDGPAYYHLDYDPWDQGIPPNPECNKRPPRTAEESATASASPVEVPGGIPREVFPLAPAWEDLILKLQNDPEIAPLRHKVTKCLRAGSGLKVLDASPLDSYMSSMDGAAYHGASDKRLWTITHVFVECVTPYYEALGKRAAKERDALVERNREAIEDYAITLVKEGYVP